MRFLMLFIALFASMSVIGCAGTSASSAAAATGEALSVVREVRERVCDPVVDLLVGPLQSRPCHCDRPASSGGSAPPTTPPPAPPSAPAAPAPSPVPTVAPAPPATPPTGPAKGSGRRS